MTEPIRPEQQRPQANTLGLVAMILGIVSLPLVFCFTLGLAVGAAAVVLGAVGLYQASQGRASNRGQATAGIALGGVAVLATILLIALPD